MLESSMKAYRCPLAGYVSWVDEPVLVTETTFWFTALSSEFRCGALSGNVTVISFV